MAKNDAPPGQGGQLPPGLQMLLGRLGTSGISGLQPPGQMQQQPMTPNNPMAPPGGLQGPVNPGPMQPQPTGPVMKRSMDMPGMSMAGPMMGAGAQVSGGNPQGQDFRGVGPGNGPQPSILSGFNNSNSVPQSPMAPNMELINRLKQGMFRGGR